MPLTIGMRLGRFEVVGPLGSGGMGEVYRARDHQLGRDVAIKVLPEAVASDPTRLARFEREARATAALAHPNILVVHDVGAAGGVPFVVFELLQGHTSRMLIGRPLGVARALDYGTQIAEGLAAAHDKGVVHRDIKPENLFVTNEGRVKSPRASPPLRRAPARAPCLGAVLYEMLAGRRAFAGETSTERLNAILTADPPPLEREGRVPPGIVEVVRRCLAKSREERFQSSRDVAFALDLAARHLAASPGPLARSRRLALLALATVAVVAALVVGAAALGWRWTPASAGEHPHLAITFPATARVSEDDDYVPFALSPDGSLLAYGTVHPEQLHLRHLNDSAVSRVAGTDGAFDPFFSPDGEWIGFWTSGHIKKIAVGGGPPLEICEAWDMLGASWGVDGAIVFGPGTGQGLFTVSAEGGEPRELTALDPARNEVHHAFPQVLDGGRTVLFTAMTRSRDAPHSAELSPPS